MSGGGKRWGGAEGDEGGGRGGGGGGAGGGGGGGGGGGVGGGEGGDRERARHTWTIQYHGEDRWGVGVLCGWLEFYQFNFPC